MTSTEDITEQAQDAAGGQLAQARQALGLMAAVNTERFDSLGVSRLEDLVFLSADDFSEFPAVKRGKLLSLKDFLEAGHEVDEDFSIEVLEEHSRRAEGLGRRHGQSSARDGEANPPLMMDGARAGDLPGPNMPKGVLPDFNGEPSKWLSFRAKFLAVLGQAHLLEAAEGNDDELEARHQVYYLLQQATAGGVARVHVKRHGATRDGAAVWQDL
ncbi:MAG: hypothetical protein AAGM67_17140, partial [Bacteroidota bacterium]